MPTHQQIIWRMRRFMRRLRANKWRPWLGSAVVVGLVAVAAVVTMLTFDRPHVGGDAASGQGSFIGGRPTVIDGDTVHWQGRIVRLVGFDTPETGDRARCQSERAKADSATARLRELVTSGSVKLELVRCACPPGTEGTNACNFGRSCGVLTVNGRDAGQILITEGLARRYRCGQLSCPPRGLLFV
jgi:endonuclease YncB( thermonuclease family)